MSEKSQVLAEDSSAMPLCSRLCSSSAAPLAPLAAPAPWTSSKPFRIAVSFELPYPQEQVFAALAAVDDPLGFDTSLQGFAQEVLWHGTKLGKRPGNASQVLLGCIRKAEFAQPFAGSTVSELVELDPPHRLRWRQLHSEGAVLFVGNEESQPTSSVSLSSAPRGGTEVQLEFEFASLKLPRSLCWLAPCATPLVGCLMRQHVASQWAGSMLRRGAPRSGQSACCAATSEDAAAAAMQARDRGAAVSSREVEEAVTTVASAVVMGGEAGELRTSRKAAVAVLGQLFERLEVRRKARGHKADRRRDEDEEQALKDEARRKAAQPPQLEMAPPKQPANQSLVAKGRADSPRSAVAAHSQSAPHTAATAAAIAATPLAGFKAGPLGVEAARVFHLVDVDGNGEIDLSEMCGVRDMVMAMDADASGKISTDEWMSFVETQATKSETRATNLLKMMEMARKKM